MKDMRAPFPRDYAFLTDFTFSAEHRAGRLNAPDDKISRWDDLPEMDRFEQDFHSAQSFVEEMAHNPRLKTRTSTRTPRTRARFKTSYTSLEELEDQAMGFADPFPSLWDPQADKLANTQSENMPHLYLYLYI